MRIPSDHINMACRECQSKKYTDEKCIIVFVRPNSTFIL